MDGSGPNHSVRRCRRSFGRKRGGFCFFRRLWADVRLWNPLACAVQCLRYIRLSISGEGEEHYKANG